MYAFGERGKPAHACCKLPRYFHRIESMKTDEVVSRRLNEECFCITLDQARLQRGLADDLADSQSIAASIAARPHLFAGTPVFLPEAQLGAMLGIVRAIESVSALPPYRDAVLAWAPAIARFDPGPAGAFMGYDFHLTDDGPKLIEVNTNAGGAFLNASLVKAQSGCCTEVDSALRRARDEAFESAVVQMFRDEWRAQGRLHAPRRIAIVDDQPGQQYLYPEFLLAQTVLQRHGLQVQIVDAGQLRYEAGQLLADGVPVDMVYNRLVDFALEHPEHAALRAAYAAGAAVVTPNPRVHALFADKRNLTLLSDQDLLSSWGVPDEALVVLRGIPRTVHVTADNTQELWQTRKQWFFKPAAGYGSKAVYRGDKLTRSVWADIVRGNYIAQRFAEPSARAVMIDGQRQTRKVDVRLYVYRGEMLLAAARLYQGQTTNFRTPGGGFASLITLAAPPGQLRASL